MKRTEFVKLLNLTNQISSFDDKLGQNAKLLMEELKPFIESHNRGVKHVQINYAHTDNDGCLVLSEKGDFKYTPANYSEMETKIAEYMQQDVVVEHLKDKFVTNPKDCMRLNLHADIPEEIKILQGFLI